MEAHQDGAVRIQQVRQKAVVHFRGRDLQKGHRAKLAAHLETPCLPETEGGRADKVLHMETGGGKPVPFKTETVPVRVEDAMQHLQPFLPVQLFCQGAHGLEMVEGVQHDTGEPGPCGLNVVCLDGEDKELCFYHAVVAMLQLSAEHIGV